MVQFSTYRVLWKHEVTIKLLFNYKWRKVCGLAYYYAAYSSAMSLFWLLEIAEVGVGGGGKDILVLFSKEQFRVVSFDFI